MADTIILMDGGKIMQKASPEVIYDDPDNVFTARFIGTPPMNVYTMKNSKIYVGFRPESVVISREKTDVLYVRKAKILTREMLGSETHYKLLLEQADDNAEPITIMVKSSQKQFAVDENVYLNVEKEKLYFFDEEENRIRDDAKLDECCQMVEGGL